jgi:hypothetical protein
MRKLVVFAMVVSMASLAAADLSLAQIAPNQAAVILDPAEAIGFYLTLEQSGTYVIELTGNAGELSAIGDIEEFGDGFDWRYITIAGLPEQTVAGQQVIIRLIGGGPMDLQLYDAAGTTAIGDLVTLPFFDGPSSIEVVPTSVSFRSDFEGVNPSDEVISIRNGGTGTLNWQLIESCDWLTASPLTGSSTGEWTDVILSVDVQSLVINQTYQCDVLVSDPNADNDPVTIPVTLEYNGDCHSELASCYDDWVTFGKPDCWCYAKQCSGDADGLSQGSKCGIWAIGTLDLTILANAWQIKEPPHGPGILYVANGVCADFDHAAQGSDKTGYKRVDTADLTILANHWQIKEPPSGPGVWDCPPYPEGCLNYYTEPSAP